MTRARFRSARLQAVALGAFVTALGLAVVGPALVSHPADPGDRFDPAQGEPEPGATRATNSAAVDESAGRDGALRTRLSELQSNLPLTFEPNQGQTAPEVAFVSRGSGYALFLTPTEAVLSLTKPARLAGPAERPSKLADAPSTSPGITSAVVRLGLVGANPVPRIAGLDPLPGRSNYFIGNDAQKWTVGVPQFARVEYEDVYPGVDLVYHGSRGELEYDFVVAPGVDPGAIRLKLASDGGARLDEGGDLVVSTAAGELRQPVPVAYQEIAGLRRTVPASYELAGSGEIRFRLAGYDTGHVLVIDPRIVYSTYLGGNEADEAPGIAVDASGSAYVTGMTNSTDFPTQDPIQPPLPDSVPGTHPFDVFVTKLSPDGSHLIYSTYLGGRCLDAGWAIAVDRLGNAYVTGHSCSFDFPLKKPLQPTYRGNYDAFVVKLNRFGSALVYSTYLGGNGYEAAYGIAVDGMGYAYVSGLATSGLRTTSGSVQPGFAGGVADAFVAKLNRMGSGFVYATYLGGSNAGHPVGGSVDFGTGIAVDRFGNAYVTGMTNAFDFPTKNAFQPAFNAGERSEGDAFVTKLNAGGTTLVYSTYLGGGGLETAYAIAVNAAGNAYVAGQTYSDDFPTKNAAQPAFGDRLPDGSLADDGFVTKLTVGGSGLVYSTFLGGAGSDAVRGIAVDVSGSAYVAGYTASADFPLTNPLQPNLLGPFDGFLTKLSPPGSALVYSTFLGGAGYDVVEDVEVDGSGTAYVTGATFSPNFPTVNAFQPLPGQPPDPNDSGGRDAFVAKIAPDGRCTVLPGPQGQVCDP